MTQSSAPPSRTSAIGRLAAFLFVAILIFSSTVNLTVPYAPALRLLSLAVTVLAAANLLKGYRPTRRGTNYIVTMMLVAALVALPAYLAGWTVTPAKVLGILLVTLCATPLIEGYEKRFQQTLVLTLVVTTLFVMAQMIGAWPDAYALQNYANEAAPVNLMTARPPAQGLPVVVPYLPQLRPSGAFPSPTYIAVFCILIWHQLVVNPRFRGRLATFLAGALFVLIGSTLGAFLVVATLLFISDKRQVAYALLGSTAAFIAYAEYSPYAFAYNFSIADVAYSFLSRMDITSGGESILQQQPWVVASAILGAVLMLLVVRRVRPFGLMRAGIAIALPVLIHDVSGSLLYWLMATLAVHALTPLGLVTNERKALASPAPIPGTA